MNTMVEIIKQSEAANGDLLQNVGKFIVFLEEQCEVDCTSLDEIYMLRSIVSAFQKFVISSFPSDTIVHDVNELEITVENRLNHLLKLGGY